MVDDADYEHVYFYTFGAIVSNFLNLLLPPSGTKAVMNFLASNILSQNQTTFLIDEYLPVLLEATKDVKVPWEHRLSLAGKVVGTVTKLIYAFLYQEKRLPTFINTYFDQKKNIVWGGEHIADVYSWANFFSGFKETDANVKESVNVYPG